MFVLSIKVPIRKKSGNLSYASRTNFLPHDGKQKSATVQIWKETSQHISDPNGNNTVYNISFQELDTRNPWLTSKRFFLILIKIRMLASMKLDLKKFELQTQWGITDSNYYTMQILVSNKNSFNNIPTDDVQNYKKNVQTSFLLLLKHKKKINGVKMF